MGMEKVIAQVNDTFRREAMNGAALSMSGMVVATPRGAGITRCGEEKDL